MAKTRKVRRSIKNALRSKMDITSQTPVSAESDPEPKKLEPTPAMSTAIPIMMEEKDIKDFYSIQELKQHLNVCYHEKTDFKLKKTLPYQDILQFILEKTKTDQTFSFFADSLKIFELIDQIDSIHHRQFKDYDRCLGKLLEVYQKLITTFNINDKNQASLLQSFFSIYKKNAKINAIRKKDGFINPFSSLAQTKSSIEDIDKQCEKFYKIQEQYERQNSQSTYWGLLEDVLEEKSSLSLLHLSEHQNSNISSYSSLLPEEEYDPPSAEPEHPTRIGINQTMSFKPTDKVKHLLDGFSTKTLQQEFLSAFPWAMHSLQQLKKAKPDVSLNLLGIETDYPSELQVAVIAYILLALDAIGKIAGFNSKLAIQNFSLIKKIVLNIESLSDSLTAFNPVSNMDLLHNLAKLTQELKQQNIDYYDAQGSDSDLNVENNPEMNLFCHINELLAHILMNQPYRESVLMPTQLESPDLEKINKIIHHLSSSSNKIVSKY